MWGAINAVIDKYLINIHGWLRAAGGKRCVIGGTGSALVSGSAPRILPCVYSKTPPKRHLSMTDTPHDATLSQSPDPHYIINDLSKTDTPQFATRDSHFQSQITS